jgi:hypothetical protein
VIRSKKSRDERHGKQVLRKIRLPDDGRLENSAEHSWQLALLLQSDKVGANMTSAKRELCAVFARRLKLAARRSGRIWSHVCWRRVHRDFLPTRFKHDT